MNPNRSLPHSTGYELSILAGCLFDPGIAEEAVDHLEPSHFYHTAHQVLFEAICRIQGRRSQADPNIVFEELRTMGKQAHVMNAGTLSSLASLPNEHPVPSNTREYTSRLKQLAALRQAIPTLSRALERCYSAKENPADLLDSLQGEILALDDFASTDDIISAKQLVHRRVEEFEGMNSGRFSEVLPTGFKVLDALLGGGLSGSKLVILAGRPGMGKTSLALSIVRQMAKRGTVVGYISLEMDNRENADRWIAASANINSLLLNNCGKGPSAETWAAINPAMASFSELPIFTTDRQSQSIRDLKRTIRRMKKFGCQAVFIDQLSHIRRNKKLSFFEANTEHIEELALLKKELRFPIILLAQLNRELERRPNKEPGLADLKQTGALEEHADVVLLLYRKSYYSGDPGTEHQAQLHLAKQRGGPTRKIELHWEPKTTTFKGCGGL